LLWMAAINTRGNETRRIRRRLETA
jgi:hypothetical protein